MVFGNHSQQVLLVCSFISLPGCLDRRIITTEFPLLLFSHSVISSSLRPYGVQHARLPCSSPTPRVCSNSCPLGSWCYLTISSSATPFSSCLGFPGGSEVKASASNAGDLGSIPGLGRSSGEGNGNSFQYNLFQDEDLFQWVVSSHQVNPIWKGKRRRVQIADKEREGKAGISCLQM